jgi:hypothetical protein
MTSIRLSTGAEGRIELHYAFGPQLIPSKVPSEEGMWRYRDLLPVGKERILYPLAVGGTPLVSPSRLRDALGVPNLWLKDETPRQPVRIRTEQRRSSSSMRCATRCAP